MSQTMQNCKVFVLNKGFIELLTDLQFPVENLNEGKYLIMDSDGYCRVVEDFKSPRHVLPKHLMFLQTQVYDVESIIIED